LQLRSNGQLSAFDTFLWGFQTMVFKRKKVATALACLVGIGSAIAVLGAAQAADIRVDVTGSNIKRTEGEGALPVDVITREDIRKTGATTVNELMRYIPTFDIYNQGEIASNSPSGSGTTTIRMRGLSENNVLVLLNGRRLPVNALYDASGAGAAVDVNMIPISAIERVEILKDGGSAIYGADAVAGVVNFITRKDFQGFEIQGRYGISQEGDGEEKNVNMAAGFGNFDADGYNVLFALDYFKRDPIYRKDREISKSVDARRFGVNVDGRSSFAPQGNYVDPDTGAYLGTSVQPCPPELYNGRCRYDFNQSLLTLYNGADRYAGMVVGQVKLPWQMKLTGQLSYAHAKDHFEAHPVPDYFAVPTGSGVIAGRFMQGGPRVTDRKSELFDANIGLEGTTKWFDWDVAVGHGESKVTNNDKNYYNANLWNEATGSGALDPTVTTNDPAFVESLKVSPVREGKSKIDFVDLRARGSAFNLPAGPIGWAVGASFWKENLTDNPDPLTQAGEVVGSIQQAPVDASRNAKAVFAEVNVPVLKNLEIQGAIRYDHYPNDSKTSPKIGAYWTPLKELGFRASYTESFRVPSLKQLYGAQEQGAGDITEDQDCILVGQQPGCAVSYFQVSGSNPNLKPEKGKTYNLGVITDVGPFSASVDWWMIDKEDAITTPTLTSALESGLFARDPNGRLLVFQNLQNTAQSKNEGIDHDVRLRLPGTLIGNMTIRNAGTYYIKQRTRDEGGEWAEFNGTYALPRYRNVFSISTEWRTWEATLINRYTSGFIDTPNPWTASDPGAVEDQFHVGSFSEWDISAAFTGFKNTRISGGVINLMNTTPPLSLRNLTDNTYEQVGFAPLYTARGRFFHIEASYSFK
jgi:iron complex outermembrane receptor protein